MQKSEATGYSNIMFLKYICHRLSKDVLLNDSNGSLNVNSMYLVKFSNSLSDPNTLQFTRFVHA